MCPFNYYSQQIIGHVSVKGNVSLSFQMGYYQGKRRASMIRSVSDQKRERLLDDQTDFDSSRISFD